MHGDIIRLPARIPQWEVDEYKAWDPTLFDDVFGRSDDDGRNSRFFDLTCSQAHGLVADRSKGNHHDDIDIVLLAATR